MVVNLYPHQTAALKQIANGKIIKGGVGSGKTITSLTYFYTREVDGQMKLNGEGEWKSPTKPMDLYVITTGKKRDDKDWELEAAQFRISTIRDKSTAGIKLTVDSWNKITDYTEVKDAFFIFDENRVVGAGAWVKAFHKIARNNRWILLSATPGDIWFDYAPIFIANGFYKNRTDFVDQHVVYDHFAKFPKVKKYIGEDKLKKHRADVLVHMPFRRHTKRHPHYEMVSYDKDLYDRVVKDRWHVFEDRPVRDVAELFALMRKITNSDISRLGAVMTVFEKHPKLIIFYNFNYELEALRTLAGTLGVPVTEWNGHKHEKIPVGDTWIYLVQYTAGAEGWNCIETDAMVFYSLNYSYKIWEQSQGRIDRLNTPFVDLHYYILRSGASIDQAIFKALASKKNFNESAYKSKFELAA